MVLILIRRIRLRTLQSLVPFFILIACKPSEDKHTIALVWENDRATGIFIPNKYPDRVAEDSVSEIFSIHLLKPGTQPAILGEYKTENEGVTFQPLVPFTPGLKYAVKKRGVTLREFEIPALNAKDSPKVLAIYPSQDSLPQNLLKIYIHFSKPMREGQSLQHLTLVKEKSDTMQGTFLDLDPELWNYERTL